MDYSTTLNYIVEGSEEDIEVECDIEFDAQKETPAKVYGPPEDCYPGDPGYFEITKITVREDAPDAKLKAGDVIQIEQVRESERDIEQEVLSGLENDYCEEPEPDYDRYDDPAHDYIYEGPSWA